VYGRRLELDAGVVEVETVNLLYAGDARFRIRRPLAAVVLGEQRRRLSALAGEMAAADLQPAATDVPARPGELCRTWCPVLHRCPAGQAHVRKYAGEETLAQRLADVPDDV